jgi:hypothetical protein
LGDTTVWNIVFVGQVTVVPDFTFNSCGPNEVADLLQHLLPGGVAAKRSNATRLQWILVSDFFSWSC